jgi:hypothetical protein
MISKAADWTVRSRVYRYNQGPSLLGAVFGACVQLVLLQLVLDVAS